MISQPKAVKKRQVLIVSDDKFVQKSLYELLCRCGYKVDLASSVEESLVYLSENVYQVAITEINGKDSMELLKIIKGNAYPSEVIILTSCGNIEAAVNSIKMGAFDYLVRPVEDEKIVSAIERVLANKPLRQTQSAVAKEPLEKEAMFHGLVGNNSTMKDIYSIVERISNSKTTVLLRGESGTGKRMIARAIHNADKKRKNEPFVEISCGALPRELIESELFGHTKGAFTGAINDRKGRFELAHGGTILLDDIDSLSLGLQVKLLRVLQEKEFEKVGDNKTIKVDVRIIVSTNQDLEKAIAEEKFRKDLYYRLNVISIYIPPLRERKGDLTLLVEHFIKLHSKENHKKIKGISKEALTTLAAYHWPGNIRELENIVERAIILDIDTVVDERDLPEIILNGSGHLASEPSLFIEKDPASLKDALKESERIYILKVLKEVGGNKKRAAKKLGVNRTTLYNKLRKYNILSRLDK